VTRDASDPTPAIVSSATIAARLPAAVRALALRMGADTDGRPKQVRLEQCGRMRQDDASRWMGFTATQTIAADACIFDWKARAGPLGLVHVRDALSGNAGSLSVKALGIIPIAKVPESPALTRGELLRYLAEIPWVPDAILHNAALRWSELAAHRIAVSAGSGGDAATIEFSLDSDGMIEGAFAADRPRWTGHAAVPTPWRGRFGDYRRHADRLLPFEGHVAWLLHGVEVRCWEGRLTSWATN
jgi:hypothetical protein